MEYQTTIEVRVSSNEAIDKDLGVRLNECLGWASTTNPKLIAKFANSCEPPLGLNITEKDVSILDTKVVRECGQ